jgi:hypothetical protein
METGKQRQNYRGKINYIEGNKVGVTLFAKRDIYGEFKKSQFPESIQVGDIFDYSYSSKSGVTITLTPKRKLSKAEIEKVRKDLEARLPKGEF